MKSSKTTKTFCIVAVASTVLALAGVMFAPVRPVRAQGVLANFHDLLVKGYQVNSTAPFVVQGDLIGDGVWQRVVGPVLGTPFSVLPAGAGFGGATCQSEYDQAVITAQDGSTLTADVYGTRCQPTGSSIAHTTNAVYTPVAGTGRFQGVAGSGPITITAYTDGSAVLALEGFARLAK